MIATGHWYYEQLWPVFVMLTSHWNLLDRHTVFFVLNDVFWGFPQEARDPSGAARVSLQYLRNIKSDTNFFFKN